MNTRPSTWPASLALLAALLVVWWAISHAGWLSPAFLPTPEATAASLAEGVRGALLRASLSTAVRVLQGWLLSSLAGVALGAAIAGSPTLRPWLQPTLEFLRPLPASAIIPVAILAFGLSDTMAIAVVAFGSVWPVLLASVQGFGAMDVRLQEVAQVLRMSTLERFWKISLPSAVPDILAGARVGLAVALILAVVTEMQASLPGLGQAILMAQRSFRTPELYAGVVMLGGIGFVASAVLHAVERHMLRWRSER